MNSLCLLKKTINSCNSRMFSFLPTVIHGKPSTHNSYISWDAMLLESSSLQNYLFTSLAVFCGISMILSISFSGFALNSCFAKKSKQTLLINCVFQKRMFWETFPNSSRSLHKKDGLSKEEYELVYKGTGFYYVFYGHLLRVSVLFALSFFAVNYAYCTLSGTEVNPSMNIFHIQLLENVLPIFINPDIVGMCIISLFTIFNIFSLILSHRCLMRAYCRKGKDEYICYFVGIINPFKTKQVVCKPHDLQRIGYGIFKNYSGNYFLKNRRIVLHHYNFSNLYHYNKLLGVVD